MNAQLHPIFQQALAPFVAPAKRIQDEREAALLKNHIERVAWLEGDSPKWACGSPVEPCIRRVLLNQSRAFLRDHQ